MASSSFNAEQFLCSTCQIQFSFKSKLDRHLASQYHRIFADSIQGMETDDVGSLDQTEEGDIYNIERHFGNNREEESDDSDEGVDDNSDGENVDIEALLGECAMENDFYPFPSKMYALLYCLLNSPKPFGESNLKFVWFVVRQTSVVPSIPTIKKFKLPGLLPPTRHISAKGEPFYVNSLTSIIRRFIGNTRTSQLVQRYPVIPKRSYRQMFHACRWHHNPRFHSPMALLHSGIQIFIRDCVTCFHPALHQTAGLVLKFFMNEGDEELYAEVDVLLTLEQYRQVVPGTSASYLPYETLIRYETILIAVSQIYDLHQVPRSILQWDASSQALIQVTPDDHKVYFTPHPFREKAHGKAVVMLPLVLFSDDTSGNRSKKWHKFDSWSVLFAGLARQEISKICNIHFCCCSDTVTAMGMAVPIAEEITLLETDGIEAYDSHLKQPVIVTFPLMYILADNPRASEILNHLGPSARRHCRMCMVDKEVNPAVIGAPRTLQSTQQQIQNIQMESLQKKKSQLRTEYGVKEDSNPMLSIPADLFQSMPVESLHTLLLGPYKYLLKTTITKLSAQQKEEVLARIRDFNYSGFDCRVIGNVIYHHQSFVGCDYKAWAQMAMSIIYPYLTNDDKTVWMALSKVFQIAYCDFFDPGKKTKWTDICQEFVDAVRQHRPDMIKKQKIHLMLHYVHCMEQFGPTSSFNTERCETFNSHIRAQNIFGNKFAPSRDISTHFACIEQLRYTCEGGFLTADKGCGNGRKHLYRSPVLQNFLNHVPMKQSYCEKMIYQPATLRKRVGDTTVPYMSLQMKLRDAAEMSLAELSRSQLPQPFTVYHGDVDVLLDKMES